MAAESASAATPPATPTLGSDGPADRDPLRPPLALTRSISLRARVAILAAVLVAIVVVLLSSAAYVVVSRALYADVDEQLQTRAATLIDGNFDSFDFHFISLATFYSQDISVALLFPNGPPYSPPGSHIRLGKPEYDVQSGRLTSSLRTTNEQRVLARRTNRGYTLVIAQDLAATKAVLERLGWVLLGMGGLGTVLAALSGMAVAGAGLRPVARLDEATRRVAESDDFTPIPVVGNDELARLTGSFNMMLRALAESRDRQGRLVADAGHELRTPLTSLRTNLELMIAASIPGARPIPEADMAELRRDVIAQIEEFSTLVGDLVDLAKEDAPEALFEQVEVSEVVERALERVRRRRPEVTFTATLIGWQLYGHEAGLQRAVLNVLDNAAKWSPAGGDVSVVMRLVGQGLMEIAVSDAGPGIPVEERELVFERFYRTTASRSMPGSGLGLAIVRQIIIKHGGTISIDTAPAGGALIRVVLPGELPGLDSASSTEVSKS